MPDWSHAGRTGVLLSSWLLASTTGCSYAFVRGPPAGIEAAPAAPQEAAAECTTSNVAPALDTVMAVAFIVVGAGLVVGGAESGCSGCYFQSSAGGFIAAGVGALALGGLYVASATTGYGRTADCRGLQEGPPPPRQSARYLLDVGELAQARSR